jgi:hypothetical protein
MHKLMAIVLVLLFTLPALAATPAEQMAGLEARLAQVAKAGSALPKTHVLSLRFADTVAECRNWHTQLKAVVNNPEAAEDIAALLWRLKEAVHRLGMLELRTRIVKATPDREPRYGLLASTGLERIADDQVPDVPVSTTLTLDAAPGETVTGRLILIAFDRGLSKPCYPSPMEFVSFKPLAGDAASIPANALAALLEDAVPTDSQRFMGGDPDFARGVQRTDYLTGASQDLMMGVGWTNYFHYQHADTAQGIRLRLTVPAHQPAGIYRGQVRVWPCTEDYPAYATLVVRVHAVPRPVPTMTLQGGFNVEAFKHFIALREKTNVEELDTGWLEGHINTLTAIGVQVNTEHTPGPRDGWLFVPDDPGGPLALSTTPLRARLLAWYAWAKGVKGVEVERVHDWTGTTQVMNIWPANGRGYNNYVKDPRRIGSLYYPAGESLRLLALREGFQDAAWLSALQAAAAQSTDPVWHTRAQSTLDRALALAKSSTPTADALVSIRTEVISVLEKAVTRQ